jgi:membrane-associated protease RseP (regulator of RpoE activity)
VLLTEPPRSAYDLHFSLLGIPVRVHPFFWVITLLLGIQSGNPTTLLSWVVVVFVSILVHEFGHALAMRHYGWQPRVTLYAMGGLASYDSASSFREGHSSPRSQILILLAGPGAGFLLAALVVAVLYATQHKFPFYFGFSDDPSRQFGVTFGTDTGNPIANLQLATFVWQLLAVNILWGVINLFPVYPLDGGQIAREVLTLTNPHDGIVKSLWLSVFTGAGLAVAGLVVFDRFFMAFMFGYLAYLSYQTLQRYQGGGGYGEGRGW